MRVLANGQDSAVFVGAKVTREQHALTGGMPQRNRGNQGNARIAEWKDIAGTRARGRLVGCRIKFDNLSSISVCCTMRIFWCVFIEPGSTLVPPVATMEGNKRCLPGFKCEEITD